VSFDPFLTLFNEAGELIAYDDDTGEGVNARISIPLPAGKYAIGATGYYATSLGDYTLTAVAGGGAVVAGVTASACAEASSYSRFSATAASGYLPFSATAASGFSLKLLAARCQRRDGTGWRTAPLANGVAEQRLRLSRFTPAER
jgi:hypothetical protein